MGKYEVRFAGFGGQGIVLAGVILGKTASLHEGKNAVQTQLYGPDSRGGAARCEVVISDDKILYPKVDQADLLVVMSQEATDKFYAETKEAAVIICDSGLVQLPAPKKGTVHYGIEATRLAEGAGNKMAANMVMLGAVAAVTRIVSLPALLKSIEQSVSGKAAEVNKKAAEKGYEIIAAAREGK